MGVAHIHPGATDFRAPNLNRLLWRFDAHGAKTSLNGAVRNSHGAHSRIGAHQKLALPIPFLGRKQGNDP